MTASAGPGWYPDPSGRHEHRWWDGTAWTASVADGGVASSEPLEPTAGGPDPSWSGPLRFLFRAPGAPPWPVLDERSSLVGWVQVPTGVVFGPRTYALVDPSGLALLTVTQRDGRRAGGTRVLHPAGAELGVLRQAGVTRFDQLPLHVVAGAQVVARVDAGVESLRAGASQVHDATGEPVARLRLCSGSGQTWFEVLWDRPAEPLLHPLVLALPLGIHLEYEQRAAFSRRNRSSSVRRRDPEWPHLER